jgi:hypothetical protein
MDVYQFIKDNTSPELNMNQNILNYRMLLKLHYRKRKIPIEHEAEIVDEIKDGGGTQNDIATIFLL